MRSSGAPLIARIVAGVNFSIGSNIRAHRNPEEAVMPKFLITASYTATGTQGLLKEGGKKRQAAVAALLKGAGGSLECFYYALGEADAYLIVDLPDQVSAAAISLAVNASGAVVIKTTPLLTPDDIDTAAKKRVGYRPPGK
jgi:uncharacterized protein with GYD domain